MANQNIHIFDKERLGEILEELLNLEGEIELGRARWSMVNVS
jgi:hypothetical protein